MTAWLAVLSIGLGSIALRVLPLLTTRRLPERLTAAAGAGGMSVLVGFSARSVLEYTDPGTPYAVPVAVVAVVAGLVAASRGRGVLTSTAVGLVVYLALATTLGAGA
jgi:branched-subunit amino acid transport protein